MTNPEPASRPRRSASYRMISGSTASRQPNVPALLPLRRPSAARLPGRRRARRGDWCRNGCWVTLLLVKIFDHQYAVANVVADEALESLRSSRDTLATMFGNDRTVADGSLIARTRGSAPKVA